MVVVLGSFWGVFGGSVGAKEWHNWKPCKQSQPSAALRTTSKTVNEFGTHGVMSVYPIVACSGLPKDEVV